jgi:hypothetical protein
VIFPQMHTPYLDRIHCLLLCLVPSSPPLTFPILSIWRLGDSCSVKMLSLLVLVQGDSVPQGTTGQRLTLASSGMGRSQRCCQTVCKEKPLTPDASALNVPG